MPNNIVFNMTVCIIGIFILLVHITNFILKKNKREDEKALFIFVTFTAFHFLTYLTFTIINLYYKSNGLIISFYTIFYIMNNLEAFLLFIYMLYFIDKKNKTINYLFLLNIILFAIITVLDFINIPTGIFFYADKGIYYRSKTMIISQAYQFIMLSIVFLVAVLSKDLNIRERLSFVFYCIIPIIAIIIQNIFKGYAIAYASIIIAVEILYFFINVQKNIDLALEEEKNKEAKIKLMLSQIRPHFIYNSLSSISTLIEIDPKKAQEALDNFTDYLRMNLSSITETKLIPFEYELKHIKTYVELEKIRFNDRINIIYDIKSMDFNVSPLSIQPIVENAIKHGILKKIEGGTIILKTYDENNNHVIEVIDDGVGFDINDVDFNSNIHFGLNNIKYRIEKYNGKMEISSKKNEGTKIKVVLNGGDYEHIISR